MRSLSLSGIDSRKASAARIPPEQSLVKKRGNDLSRLSEIARARNVSDILAREQEPFWLTSGSIALSNLGITPPSGAQWWWTGRIAFVFVRHQAVRFSVDARECSFLWEGDLQSGWDKVLTGHAAAGILQKLVTANPRYRQLVDKFSALSLLEGEYVFLEGLKTETQLKVAEELRAELRAEELRSTQARGGTSRSPRKTRQKPALRVRRPA